MVKVADFFIQALLLSNLFELLLDSQVWEKSAGNINVISIIVYKVNLIH